MFKEVKRLVSELVETFVCSLVVILVLYMWVALPEQVWGQSMEPSFYTGERVLVEKVTKHIEGFNRGDVVVLHPPSNDSIDYIKRIVAMPGELVKVSECNVYIFKDGKTYQLEEPYLKEDTCTKGGSSVKEGRYLKVEDGFYFVLGDNRGNSADSRFFGLVERDRILGKAVLRFWPINKLGFL